MAENLAVVWVVVLTMLTLCMALGFFVGMSSPRS